MAIAQHEVVISSDSARLGGSLDVPHGAKGLVLFAHGSGSSRFSPRNQYVAAVLRERGLGTLLLDLLEPSEADDRLKVFDIDLLARRLAGATDWAMEQDATKDLHIGYFGASTGAAAALQAAALRPDSIRAVVSRGGRPDLAMAWLGRVNAPTLLIVGGDDDAVIPLNQTAYDHLPALKELVIVSGATHLFEEPGKLEEVARLASEWFEKHLA